MTANTGQVLAALLCLMVLTACSDDGRKPIDQSPYEFVVPKCPAELSQESATYASPPPGTFYRDASVLSRTERICEDGGFRLWMIVSEFKNANAASTQIGQVRRLASYDTSDRLDTAPGADEFVRADFRSEDWECIDPPEEMGAICSVSDHIALRFGNLLVEVIGEDRDAYFEPRAIQFGGTGVVGDARWALNETLVKVMASRLH